jgi:hypothetical protein
MCGRYVDHFNLPQRPQNSGSKTDLTTKDWKPHHDATTRGGRSTDLMALQPHNPFFMDNIEAGRPSGHSWHSTAAGQLRHPAICIYDPWVAGILKNHNLPLEHQTLCSSTKPSARVPNPSLEHKTLCSSAKPSVRAPNLRVELGLSL